jgi:Zn-dependent membrane protease YugP
MKVVSKYSQWSKVRSRGQITGAEAAAAVMKKAGINDVSIVSVHGKLSDHYDPVNRKLALSEDNYHGTSLAALGVAAHEAGHAIQHKQGYAPLQFRSALIPITNIASQLLPFVIFGGFFMNVFGLVKFAVWIYLIQSIPTGYYTGRIRCQSSRHRELETLGIVERDEERVVTET